MSLLLCSIHSWDGTEIVQMIPHEIQLPFPEGHVEKPFVIIGGINGRCPGHAMVFLDIGDHLLSP